MTIRIKVLGTVPVAQVPTYLQVLTEAAAAAGIAIQVSQEPVSATVRCGFLWLRRRRDITHSILVVRMEGRDAGAVADYENWFLPHVSGSIRNGRGPDAVMGSYLQRIASWQHACDHAKDFVTFS